MKISFLVPGLAALAVSMSSVSCVTAPASVDSRTSQNKVTASTTTTKSNATSSAPVGKSSEKVKPYLLDTCIVSDEGLESMGGSISKVYQGQQVKFCCKGCVKDFDASPGEYLAKLN